MFVDLLRTQDFKRSLFNAVVAPRPIGWISTLNDDGTANLAPFSHFNLVSSSPAMVIFSCNTPADRAEKDTLRNVRRSGEFVVNLVSRELLFAANASSAATPYGLDEFDMVGLAKAPSRLVAPPRVAAAPAHLECRLQSVIEIEAQAPGDTTSHVVLGRVVGIHLRDSLVDAQGRFDTVGAKLMTRMGGLQYAGIGEVVELPAAHRRTGDPA